MIIAVAIVAYRTVNARHTASPIVARSKPSSESACKCMHNVNSANIIFTLNSVPKFMNYYKFLNLFAVVSQYLIPKYT